MSRLIPRTIRGQLTSGLIIFEILVLAVFSLALAREQQRELQTRTDRRLEYQASLLAIQSSAAMAGNHYGMLDRLLAGTVGAPSIRAAQITDLQGRTLFSSADPGLKGTLTLSPRERTYLRELERPVLFSLDDRTREVVAPVRVQGAVKALVWIYPDNTADRIELRNLLDVTMLIVFIGIIGCTVFATFMAQSIARPIGTLMQATRRLIRDPEDTASFPITVAGTNEAADLAIAFNRMMASVQAKRAGLTDALALLDSMLAHAPVGFAFFDHDLRFVRMNEFLASMNDLPLSRHIGRSIHDVFKGKSAALVSESVRSVFEHGHAVQNVELSSESESDPAVGRSWLTSIYPVRAGGDEVRWAGMILVETTERRRAEDTLRRTEKLAAAGRLAASIAHEINNPLEAVTNLLFLLQQGSLDAQSSRYADMAAQQIDRVSQITQQTLRFYRQSTLPSDSCISELVDSMLALHHGRVIGLEVEVRRRYAPDVHLFCFAGELRQLFANLIANALDAIAPGGGCLSVRVRYARSPAHPEQSGVRVTIADSGTGMTAQVRRHIFEPFFTTKDATGTGLGLWVSAEIVAKHNGSIRVRTRARDGDRCKSGTVFAIFFPLRSQTSAP